MPSLYQTYRPQVFQEVIGQDHITAILEAAVKEQRIGHAYLFSGPRGTGKTTVARLLAKAINCQNSEPNYPCNNCLACQAINQGQVIDVIEIDAASNRGIDEIRELRERVVLAPLRTRFKVYIIDEVHMLTKEAFNALLKTLEEPPGHAVFILATTELHKVPETIISRCQRYHFHRAAEKSIIQLLEKVAAAEKIVLDQAATQLIAKRADGSYRDALTLLQSLAAHHQPLTAAAVRQLIGLPDSALVECLLRLVREGKSKMLISELERFINEGGDLAVLTRSCVDHLKQRILTGSSDDNRQLVLLIEELLVNLARARHSTDPTAVLLATLTKLSLINEMPTRSPSERSADHNERPATTPLMVTDLQPTTVASEGPALVDSVTATAKEGYDQTFWSELIQAVKQRNHALYAVVRLARLANLTSDKIVIAVKYRFYSERLLEAKNRRLIETLASQTAGRPLLLECQVIPELDQAAVASSASDELFNTVVDVFELEDLSRS